MQNGDLIKKLLDFPLDLQVYIRDADEGSLLEIMKIENEKGDIEIGGDYSNRVRDF